MLQPAMGFTDPHAAPIPLRVCYIAQAPYLTNNWKAIQAQNEYQDFTKFVRVLRGVANITNGSVQIRFFAEIPDGFYVLGTRPGELREVSSPDLRYHTKFPDVESALPSFQRLDWSKLIYRDEVANFIGFLNFVRSGSIEINTYTRVQIDSRCAFQLNSPDRVFNFSTEMPVKFEGLVFDANNLKLAFTEMLRYDQVCVGVDNSDMIDGIGAPSWDSCSSSTLVVGCNDKNCALVKVERVYRGARG